MASIWDTAEFWVLGGIFGVIFAKGIDLMFADHPRPYWGAVLTTVGLIGLLLTIPWTRERISRTAFDFYARFGSPYPTISFVIVILLGTVIGGLSFGAIWQLLSKPQAPDSASTPFTLHDVYRSDLGEGGAALISSWSQDFTIRGAAEPTKHDFEVGFYINWQSRSVYMSLYMPADISAYEIIEWFSYGYKAYLADMRKNFHVWPQSTESPQVISDTFTFTKTIYVYHENILTGEQIHHLGKLCTGRCAERLGESGHDNRVQRMEVE